VNATDTVVEFKYAPAAGDVIVTPPPQVQLVNVDVALPTLPAWSVADTTTV
jgi:hypothetical protein